jgi:hypothetical protein
MGGSVQKFGGSIQTFVRWYKYVLWKIANPEPKGFTNHLSVRRVKVLHVNLVKVPAGILNH